MSQPFPSTVAARDVVHVSPRVQARGGIETLHGYHRDLAEEQVFVALFDRAPVPRPGYINLDFTWRTPLWVMRRRFARALAPYANRTVIYHNGWGLPLFQDLDGARRRLMMLHADPAYHAADLPGFSERVDGALLNLPVLQEATTAVLPELAGARVGCYRVPIEAPPGFGPRPARRTLKLGYAGRIERAQKRLDRLPDFLRAMRATGVDYQFEIVGEGSYRRRLERQLAGQAKFHGWVSREEYWRVLAGWDAVVFFSEHEGGPISLMEGMTTGALPFYPAQNGSWADIYAPQVDPFCHYPPGDVAALAAAIQTVFQRPPEELARLRERSRSLVTAHCPAQYVADCRAFIAGANTRPRISVSPRRRSRLGDLLPLGLVARVAPMLLARR